MSKLVISSKLPSDAEALSIAQQIEVKFNNDATMHTRAIKTEYYRSIMYDTVENAEGIDGTSTYWKIVRYLESILTNDAVERDW